MAGLGHMVAVPETEDQSTYRRLDQLLGQSAPRIVGDDGETAELPPTLLRMVRELAHLLATNHVAILTSAQQNLTTQQAADLLGISRPTLVRLLEEERAIPFARVGTHRRIRFADLLAYRQQLYQRQRQAMAELTALGEEMGGYGVPVDEEPVLSSAAR
jgi:excisionase family DNA binding protein